MGSVRAKTVIDALTSKDHFAAQALRSISNSVSGGGDIGEVLLAWNRFDLATDKGQTKGDAWFDTWSKLAEDVEARADNFNCPHSKATSHLRATDYFRTSEFFIRGLDNLADPRRQLALNGTGRNFQQYLKHSGKEFDFFRTELCAGYIIKPEQGVSTPHPLVILPSGYDAICEEQWFAAGMAAHTRGYVVVLVDGPGQGHVLRDLKNPLYLSPELYDMAMVQLVDMLGSKDFIDESKIALFGRSFAGCLSIRAAASLKGKLAALLLDPPQPNQKATVLGLLDVWEKRCPGISNSYENGNKVKFDELFRGLHQIGSNWDSTFFWESRMGVHNQTSFYDMLQLLTQFDAVDILESITCPIWATDNSMEHIASPNVPLIKAVFGTRLTVSDFTPEQGSLGHCAQGNALLFSENCYDWLYNVFNR